jgi:hypothetical protein
VESRKHRERVRWCNVEAAICPAIAAILEREKQPGTQMIDYSEELLPNASKRWLLPSVFSKRWLPPSTVMGARPNG